ncbi:MAG: sulfite exporter TauE/SafE family protein [Gaiellales bacterium]
MPIELLALPLGVIIGISLGALGAGGSILTVPALVILLGQTPQEAAATSLIVVGSIAGAGVVSHRRRGAVRMRSGLAFAAAGIVGSLLASLVSLRTDPDALALAFSVVMVIAATMMWMGRKGDGDGEQDSPPHNMVGRTLIAGTIVGAMTGFFGIGGGFLAVPALTWALGLPMATAVGTSLLVISINSATALVPRLADGLIDPTITVLFVIGGVLGSMAGARLAHRVAPGLLRRTFAVAIVLTAIVLVVTTLLG